MRILYLDLDTLRPDHLGCYGYQRNTSPNIDRIAREGILFENCFVTNSICTPSRSVIFTGKYSHINGVYKFTALDQSQPTLPKLMRKAGYQTAFVGKYHLHSNPGWHRLYPWVGRATQALSGLT